MKARPNPRIERSEDGQAWEPIDYRAALIAISDAYRNVDDVFATMRAGHPIQAAGAWYRITKA